MRMRRIRNNKILREMTQETSLDVKDFIYPLFVVEGENIKREIPSLVDQYHYSVDMLDAEIEELESLGIRAVILFGIPDKKDSVGSGAYDENGIVQRAVREIKKKHPDFIVITDVCMCEYTDHGHCGILDDCGCVINDETIKYIARTALSHAKAGADIVAPSDMMDFRVRAIREALDENGFKNVPIMSYAAKYASAYYGPFRDAAGSAPSFGDRKGYQMDFHNSDEAMKEVELDLEEDADFIIVKPALAYLDIIRRVKETFNTNLVVYNVSGEYAMIKEAIKKGLLNESIIYENMIAMKRAGAKLIITYHAKEMARLLKERA
ncbi:MAG: porphobilinogen synthase [Ezakiella sp.]|uniref:porphobilinogen synthase n=1 Tax=Ezakiella sp. TaxID=1935205 RepID=UPI00297B6E7A|nr:porphobilinogen synthase [Ezakiella sp.]MDD7730739.1 porphobilinogen synthase [Eubacteriales bacterium]MDY6080294.1 porphobilinogen synthase [Ezakiella sp.]